MTVNNEVTVTNQGTPQPQGPQQMEIQNIAVPLNTN